MVAFGPPVLPLKKRQSVLFKKKNNQSFSQKKGPWQRSQETYIKPVYMYLSYSGTLSKVHRVIQVH